MPHDFEKWRRQGVRHGHRLPRWRCGSNIRNTLRERFYQSYAEGPDIGWFGDISLRGFRTGICVGLHDSKPRLARAANRIAGEFELVVDRKDIAGTNLAVHEAFAVEISECVHEWFEHVPRLGWRKRAMRKEVGKIFGGLLHDDIEHI